MDEETWEGYISLWLADNVPAPMLKLEKERLFRIGGRPTKWQGRQKVPFRDVSEETVGLLFMNDREMLGDAGCVKLLTDNGFCPS